MDDRLIDFKLVVDQVGDFNMDSLRGRIALQKKIYLLQLSGLDLGYRFNWYIRGPYSPSLADIAFEVWNNKEYVAEEVSEYELGSESLDLISKIKGLITSKSPFPDLEDYGWLELLASVHYIRHIAYSPNQNKDKQHICQSVLELKPQYKLKHVEKAWDTLNEWDLIENKTLDD